MKLRRFFTLITCVGLTGAVGDMTVEVKRGENIILPVKTHAMGAVNRVMLRRYENGTKVDIFRYCSNKETKRGCAAIDNDRVLLQLGSENISVIIRDARATDAEKHFVEVIGNNTMREEFTVVLIESSGGQSTTLSPPIKVIIGVVTGVTGAVIAMLIIVVAVYLCKKKNLKKLDSCDSTVDLEVVDSQSSITGGAVGDMTVEVKRGENIILPVKTYAMGAVNRVTLRRYENGTKVDIFRYCSNKETKRGCAAIDNDRVIPQLGSENVSVIIRDARATDAEKHFVEVIGNNTIREEFTVVLIESSGGQSTTLSPPIKVIIGVVTGVIGVVIAMLIIVVAVYLCKNKNRKKPDSCDSTVDLEVADSQSSITGGQSTRLDVLRF
ncbi:hypothetical protein ROHU_002214 [Labeo rohita]|uniref:Uncharacterized protein n=1 Tax=Labeo rohita TaxID=84645 RepID=A0A498P002_LABRO|nr:hypothetical protein ROHU_002214 [Labeo rohita]